MNGNVKFEDALGARLALIKPSKRDVKACLKNHSPRLTRGASRVLLTVARRWSIVD